MVPCTSILEQFETSQQTYIGRPTSSKRTPREYRTFDKVIFVVLSMGARRNKGCRKRRKFHGNQLTVTETPREDTFVCQEREGRKRPSTTPDVAGASSPNQPSNARSSQYDETPLTTKRLKTSNENEDHESMDNSNDYFVLMNFECLIKIIETVGHCPNCLGQLKLENQLESRMGFACKLKLACGKCNLEQFYYTSNKVDVKEGPGRKSFEVNLRAAVAFREIGKGHQGLENFSRVMNMHGISSKGYEKISHEVHVAYDQVGTESMRKAGCEVHAHGKETLSGDPSIALCECSFDGTRQKRGHSSYNGVVTAISMGKCIDRHVMSKYCRGCQKWNTKQGTTEFDHWKAEHSCPINHTKSCGAMEAAGAVAMFSSSVEKHKLIYSKYIGDGDTSSFKEVVNAKPYVHFNITPTKLECVGHVQKRLGTRLRDLRKAHKNSTTSMSGRGKLTDKVINTLQNYLGMAIRDNKGNLYQMKKAVGAVLWHCTQFADEAFRHRFCPSNENSWCKWQRDQITGNSTYKKSINLPKWIHDLLKPIFQDLSSDELLSKCLHGKTQNANESLNNLIWRKCPKNVFVQRDTLECAVNSAVIEFNEGPCGISDVLKELGMLPGVLTERGSDKKTVRRMKNMKLKLSEHGKKRRKVLRGI